MIPQRDLTPSRERPNDNTPREEGAGCANSSTVTSKAPKCPVAVRILPFTTGNSVIRGGVMAAGGSIITVTCPAHGSMFALNDGRVMRGPATRRVIPYEARIRDEEVEIRARRPATGTSEA